MRVRAGILLCLLLLSLCAGCAREKSSSSAALEPSAAVETETDGETALQESTETVKEGNAGAPGTERQGENTESVSDTDIVDAAPPRPLEVIRHKEEGTHMVTAGALTISVPTTFEGLEMEGAEFQGDQELVLSGKTGTCRVKYRGSFGSIRITVKNNTEYDMAVRDCTIIGIEIGSTEPDPELTLFGIPMGATRQEIADVYGEPFSKTFDDENGLSNMVYQFGTDIHSNQVVMIIFRDKKAVAASYEDFSLVRR